MNDKKGGWEGKGMGKRGEKRKEGEKFRVRKEGGEGRIMRQ